MQKNKIQKALAFFSVASVLLLTGSSQAFASFQSVNNGTGFSSANDVAVSAEQTFANLNSNTQAITNVGDGSVVSGGNLVDGNTTGGFAGTGVIAVDGQFSNDVNSNVLNHVESFMSDPLAVNQLTGACSVNSAATALSDQISAVNDNSAAILNHTNAAAISGNNVVKGNTGLGGVATGDILGTIETDNQVNANWMDLSSGATGLANLQAVNDTTGYQSQNDAAAVVSNSIEATNTNQADIGNNIYALFNSGENFVGFNTGNADVKTGSVAGDVSVNNNFNANIAKISLDGGACGAECISAANSKTGAGSVNNAEAVATQSAAVENTNVANIENNVVTKANSGKNKVIGNTGGALLQTGGAANNVAIANGDAGNTNETVINMGGGSNVSAVNNLTGADSANNAAAMSATTVAATNTNTANLENNVHSTANSGGNAVNYNTGVGAVATGDAVNSTSIDNNVNSNVTHIDAAPAGSVSAGNVATGANSVNNASAVSTNNVSVTNTNEANITNNVSTTSNTGGNSVSGNTCGGAVTTGDAALSFGVSNSGNSNTTTVGN